MLETHPFSIYIPPNVEYIILGSFAGRQAVKGTPTTDESYDWYYGTKRNLFWPLLEEVYGTELRNKNDKQELFKKLNMAIADIIYQCERKNGNNLDSNLENIVYNIESITKIFDNNQIKKIYFTSQFVKVRFKKVFKDVINRYPNIELISLPSPSTRYAIMNKEQKSKRFKELLPNL
jgi:hypoxanthine-DNA glycosylase